MKKTAVVCVVLAGLLAGAALLSLCVGSANLSLGQLFAAFGDESLPAHTIFLQIRLPRVLLAMLVGAALSGAGALVQGVFKNPMADPYILGVSSGAALGAAIGMVFFESSALLPPIAFLGGLGAVSLVWFLSRKGGTVSLLLAGTAVSAFLSAAVSSLMLVDRDKLERVYLWTMGSLSSATWEKLFSCLPFVLLGLSLSLFFCKDLNAMLLGDEQAQSLGVDAPRVRLIVTLLSTLVAAAAVSVSGVIGFVGLMVPHGVRFLVGPSHERLVPVSALAGSLVLLVVDTLARTLLAPSEIPIGVLTALLGAPFFLVLLCRSLKEGGVA